MKKYMILIAALVGGLSAQAQQAPWSLTDCISYALEHNLTVQQSALKVEQQEVELSTAQGRRLPTVNASASENFSFGRGLTADNTYSNSNTTSTSFQLGGNIPVFQGFDINNGIKLSKLNLAAATADLEKARDDIRVAVAQAYVQILYNQELLRVAKEQAAHDEQLLEQIRERLNAGKVSAAEVSAQQATLAQSRQSE
ncbi:MAG: TolC family protein, partial [Bacteroidales bacterium]|nr:TolC family protein [Bacteroidales bacterium]